MAAQYPAWVVPAAVLGSLIASSLLETHRPLRRRLERRGRRFARNAAVGALGFLTIGIVQGLALAPFAERLRAGGLGLLSLVSWPPWLELLLGLLLLDWTLWVWHLANHRVPFLWRFHAVHHVDLDLDASTGLRFHFGELALSCAARALQLAAIGPAPPALLLWQALLGASIFFHHGNVRLPLALESALVRLVVTPRMHGIHHSAIRAERDANFASLLTVWDRLHGTLRLNVPQGAIEIGVPGFIERGPPTLGRILLQPFRRQPPAASAPARIPPCPPPSTRLAG
jgi:sterol desaturase/sphingolipid hydroxylase (fatty acid hydroxylase superfamily)